MVPFLDLEKTSKESPIKQNKTSLNDEEKEDFSDFLTSFFNNEVEEKKSDFKKSEKDSKKIEITDKKLDKEEDNKALLKPLTSSIKDSKKIEANFLKSLDEKYNLIPSNLKDKKTLNTSPKSEKQDKIKDFKSLKDIVNKADNLNLNLTKISISNKEAVSKKDLPLDLLVVINPKQKIEKTALRQSNLLGNILQDKELLKKEIKNHKEKINKKVEIESKSFVKNEKNTKDSKKIEITNTPKNIEIKSKKNLNDENLEKISKAQKIQETIQEVVQDKTQDKVQEKTILSKISQSETTKEIKNENPKEQKLKDESIFKEILNPKKESRFLKEEKSQKDDKKSLSEIVRESKNNVENIALNLQKEVQREVQKEQISFLDNLFSTQNTKQTAQKQILDEVVSEKEKENTKEKIKNKDEVFSTSFQTNTQNRLEVQNTFSHFSDKLKEAIQNYKPPVTKLSLELNPDNLGSVELTLTKRGDKIHVQVGSNAQALQLFMQNAQEFKGQLNNLGFSDVSLDFKDTGGNSLFGDGGFNQNQQQNPQQEQNQNHALKSYQQNETENALLNVAEMEISFYYEA